MQEKQWQLSHTIRNLFEQWHSTLKSKCLRLWFVISCMRISSIKLYHLIGWYANFCSQLFSDMFLFILQPGNALRLHRPTILRNSIFQKGNFATTCCEYFIHHCFYLDVVAELWICSLLLLPAYMFFSFVSFSFGRWVNDLIVNCFVLKSWVVSVLYICPFSHLFGRLAEIAMHFV